jgi:transposase-like protein
MQHFLLSAASRTLSLKEIYKGGEDAAYATFRKVRWPETDGAPVCPRCGGVDAYEIKSRRKFECRACKHHFSVTSGTIFASRKMAYVDLLAAICLVVNACKGLSMVQISRDLDCQYKTAFVMAHKIREAMASARPQSPLEGDVEVDGMYNGGYVRPANLKEDRVDRRKLEQTGKRRVVLAFLSARAAPCHSWLSKRPKASNWPSATCPVWRSCMPMKPRIGTTSMTAGRWAASITRKPTAPRKAAPTKLKATSHACAG